jgi:hypothetical protein
MAEDAVDPEGLNPYRDYNVSPEITRAHTSATIASIKDSG